ncbi:MAG: hypothetical protein A2W99_07955 [Bacteroidetes bacterium GWF2_33_16]|nr:MAG: hypothetical protein A2X00_11010 [Bacteroidetes bacterium GWE2_32_14]OFY03709.1 MAG: hypothetical protein A2W99_07955 [Bacteroidetes bacterium GWF2_33_16]
MRSIFGRINRIHKLNENSFKNSLDRLTDCPDIKIQFEIDNLVGFGQVLFSPSPETGFFSTSDYIVIADCRIDNKQQLAENLQLNELNPPDDYLILKAYEKWGVQCAEHIVGDFAFAIWNKQKEEIFCARDHFGIKPFYYCFDEKGFIFSSEIKAILTQTDLDFTPNEQYIADTLSIVKSEKDSTFYSEIKKLPPAHYFVLKNDQLEVKEYWKLLPQETLGLNHDEIINQFKELLVEAVKCRASENLIIGSELSGGIDSSSITAIAAQFCRVKTFSHVMPDNLLGKIHPFKDEREYITLLDDYCDIQERFFITSESTGVLNAINQNLEDLEFITQQNFSVFSDCLYIKAQEEGVSILFSGFGGDEVVSSKSGSYMDELASQGLWNELKQDLKNQNLTKKNYYKRLYKYYLKNKLPVFFRLISKLKEKSPWYEGKFENLAINKLFSDKMKIRERYYFQFEKNEKITSQEKNIERICHPHVSQRLEYCSTAARKFGIEYSYPLFDKRLIEYYLSMPVLLKARNGVQRYTIRKAIEKFVPEKIYQRNDKSGTTIPTTFMRMLSDKDKISEIILRAKANPKITQYINLDAYEKWFSKLCKRSEQKENSINPGAFYNYLKLILFIEKKPHLFK